MQVTGAYVAPKAGRVSVGELYAKWLGTQCHLKKTTASTRRYTWPVYVAPRWSAVAVADVQTTDVRAWVQSLTSAGAGAAAIENAVGILRLVATDATFPVVTPHDLRHTAASLAISAGANVKAVQTMLGHASAVLTLDSYADLFPDDVEMVSAALDEARTQSLKSAAD